MPNPFKLVPDLQKFTLTIRTSFAVFLAGLRSYYSNNVHLLNGPQWTSINTHRSCNRVPNKLNVNWRDREKHRTPEYKVFHVESNWHLNELMEWIGTREVECLFHYFTALTCTCVGIHPGRVEPASPITLTTSRTEALQAGRSCASSLENFTQSFLHRAWPKTRSPERGSRSALIVVAHVFSWPPARLRHVRGCVGRRRSLISSPWGRLAA